MAAGCVDRQAVEKVDKPRRGNGFHGRNGGGRARIRDAAALLPLPDSLDRYASAGIDADTVQVTDRSRREHNQRTGRADTASAPASAVRDAIALGGDTDTDTLACITGAVAEAIHGVPAAIAERARGALTPPTTLGPCSRASSGPRTPAPIDNRGSPISRRRAIVPFDSVTVRSGR